MSDFTDEQIRHIIAVYESEKKTYRGSISRQELAEDLEDRMTCFPEWYVDKIKAMRAALHTLGHMPEDTSDGYHTFAELYDYRMLYNAHAANGWHKAGIPVVKSWRHSDGEPCFGGGWFIVTAQFPTGQVSNHYEARHWNLFDVPAVESAPEWDGHTPRGAAERLRAALKKEARA